MSELKVRTLCELDNEYLKLSYYYCQTFSQGKDVPMNTHDRFEVMLVESGEFDICFGNLRTGVVSEKVHIKKDQAILIDTNLPHSMQIAENSKIYNVEFSPVPVSSCPFHVVPHEVVFRENSTVRYMTTYGKNNYYICNDFVNIRRIIMQMYAENDENNESDAVRSQDSFMMTNLLIQQLFITFSRSFMEYHKANGVLYIREVNRYIVRNYQSEITVKGIADSIGLNVTHLQKFYKKYSGMTISEALCKFRIKKAVYLIENTNLCLFDVGISVGFNSRQVFLENFRKITGLSPSEYRKKALKKRPREFVDGKFIDSRGG